VDQLGGGFFNAERDITPVFNENLPAALYLINWSIVNFGAFQAQEREARTDRLNGRGKVPGRHQN
jgi:nucleoid DNA-binding protein